MDKTICTIPMIMSVKFYYDVSCGSGIGDVRTTTLTRARKNGLTDDRQHGFLKAAHVYYVLRLAKIT